MSRHEPRQKPARELGATDVVTERGDDGGARTSVMDPVGTQESRMQSIRATRADGHGGPAPVRRFLPELIELICHRTIDPGKVFDLEQAAEGYRAVDERRAIKALLRP